MRGAKGQRHAAARHAQLEGEQFAAGMEGKEGSWKASGLQLEWGKEGSWKASGLQLEWGKEGSWEASGLQLEWGKEGSWKASGLRGAARALLRADGGRGGVSERRDGERAKATGRVSIKYTAARARALLRAVHHHVCGVVVVQPSRVAYGRWLPPRPGEVITKYLDQNEYDNMYIHTYT